MKYVELKVQASEKMILEIMVSELEEMGFESFVHEKDLLKAYVKFDVFDEHGINLLIENYKPQFADLVADFTEIEEQNWNLAWEQSFQPIVIAQKMIIRAPFHNIQPAFEHELIIIPKMSFGTGHHATTQLMCEAMLEMPLTGKSILDIGCGTGVLAIFAMKLGANNADALDSEAWAVENALENAALNHVPIHVEQTDSETLDLNKTYDFVFANINRNIIVRDLERYIKHLNKSGAILLSGFLQADEFEIIKHCNQKGLRLLRKFQKDEWLMLKFEFKTKL